MSRLALPGGDAAAAIERQQLTIMRFEAATRIMAHLMAFDYGMAQHKAAKEQDPFEVGNEDGGGNKAIRFQLDLSCPASIAVQAADALLMTLGHIKPPSRPSINEGPR